jgi:hypothetical protein
MNLPIQSAPVMRGQDRGTLQPPAPGGTVAASQAAAGNWCSLCALLPAPYNTICQTVCGNIHFG